MAEMVDQTGQILTRLFENKYWVVLGFTVSAISIGFYNIARALRKYRLTKKYFAKKYIIELSVKDDIGKEKLISLSSDAGESEIISSIRKERGKAFVEDSSTDDNR